VDSFRAYLVEHREGEAVRRLGELTLDELSPGEVTIRVDWSSVNYKDALAVSPTGRVARVSPLVPGIDLAGEVVASESPELQPGQRVLAHGYELGVSHFGGYAELARVPAGWVVPLPDALGAREAMAIGTAGYTAALSVLALEERGLEAGEGPVLVLGASGGVGSIAVMLLVQRGHEVWASTGKAGERELLLGLGAEEVLAREETSGEGRPLESERWAGCVDPVGGAATAYALRTLRRGAAIATSGMVGGADVHTTVFPFILRGTALLGIDSGETPIARRREVWRRLADDLRPLRLEELTRETTLDDLDATLDATLRGEAIGRTVVRIAAG
jgi:putative YhdH/YhfP family quinone oxidoreductase